MSAPWAPPHAWAAPHTWSPPPPPLGAPASPWGAAAPSWERPPAWEAWRLPQQQQPPPPPPHGWPHSQHAQGPHGYPHPAPAPDPGEPLEPSPASPDPAPSPGPRPRAPRRPPRRAPASAEPADPGSPTPSGSGSDRPVSARDAASIPPRVLRATAVALYGRDVGQLTDVQRDKCVAEIIKRRSRNSEYARRSRTRKREHAADLEKRVSELEAERDALLMQIRDLENMLGEGGGVEGR